VKGDIGFAGAGCHVDQHTPPAGEDGEDHPVDGNILVVAWRLSRNGKAGRDVALGLRIALQAQVGMETLPECSRSWKGFQE